MVRRRARRFENGGSSTVYSPEQYQHLRNRPGTQDRAQDRQGLSESEIRQLCARLDVGDDVAEEAIRIYRQAIRTELVNNYLNGSLMAAAVYTACRKYGEPRTIDDVTAAAYVRVARDEDSATGSAGEPGLRPLSTPLAIQRAYNTFRDRFDRRYDQVEPEKFAHRYCEELDLGEDVAEVVQVTIKQVDGAALAGRDSSLIAAGAIYYAADMLDLDLTRTPIRTVAHCGEDTVSEMRTVIQENIEP